MFVKKSSELIQRACRSGRKRCASDKRFMGMIRDTVLQPPKRSKRHNMDGVEVK
jgi:hypothetical protein